MAEKQPLLASPGKVAEILGISRTSVYTLDAAGHIPQAVFLGGRRLWRTEELRQWVEGGCPCREKWAAMQGGNNG